MNSVYVSDAEVKSYVLEIIRQLTLEDWRPSLVIGPARGGVVPANYISQFYNIPCYIFNKNCHFNYEYITSRSNVLYIDDINDSGASSQDAKSLIDSYGCKNVRYCYLINNEASSFKADYAGKHINKIDDPRWIIFPWETWWT